MTNRDGPAPVPTVLGPLTAEGYAEAHGHLWINRQVPDSPSLTDERAAVAELRDFAATGGGLVVDCQPGACGRDASVLVRLAEAAGVAVVASTGFHLERYYRPGYGPWSMEPSEAAALFSRELRDGLSEAPTVRAGVVKTAWTGRSPREEALMRAALQAARESNAGVVVHTEMGVAVEALLPQLRSSGLPPGRVQLSHVDKRPDLAFHSELAEEGYLLGYDTFLRPHYEPERYVWPLLERMLADGWAQRITLGLDLVSVDRWHVRGGPGLRAIPEFIVPRLRQLGVGETAVSSLTGGNVMRMLAARRDVPLSRAGGTP